MKPRYTAHSDYGQCSVFDNEKMWVNSFHPNFEEAEAVAEKLNRIHESLTFGERMNESLLRSQPARKTTEKLNGISI